MAEHRININTSQAVTNVDNLSKSLDNSTNKLDSFKQNTDNLEKSSKGLQGGFQAAVGAITLFTGSSEEASKAMAKLSGLMNITSGLKDLGEGAKAFNILKGSIIGSSTALQTFKKALISTGLGAVVVLVGELVAHWKDIAKWIGISSDQSERFNRFQRENEELINKTNENINTQIRILKAQGKNEGDILKYRKEELKMLLQKEKLNLYDLQYEKKRAEINGASKKELEQYNEAIKQQVENVNKVAKEMKDLNVDIRVYNEAQKKAAEDAKKQAEEEKKKAEAEKAAAAQREKYRQKEREAQEEQNRILEEQERKNQQQLEDAKKRNELLDEYVLTEEELLKKRREEEESLVRKYLTGTELETALANIAKKYEKEDDDTELQKLIEKYENFGKTELEILKENYEKELELAGDNDELKLKIEKSYHDKKEELEKQALNKKEELEKQELKNTISVYTQMADVISGAISSIASNFDESSDAYKTLMIMQTTVATLTGIVKAISAAYDLGLPLGPIVAASQTASLIATGISTISAIKSEKGDGSSLSRVGGSANNVTHISAQSVADLNRPVSYTQNQQPTQDETKVYVVETDISKKQKERNKLRTQVKF